MKIDLKYTARSTADWSRERRNTAATSSAPRCTSGCVSGRRSGGGGWCVCGGGCVSGRGSVTAASHLSLCVNMEGKWEMISVVLWGLPPVWGYVICVFGGNVVVDLAPISSWVGLWVLLKGLWVITISLLGLVFVLCVLVQLGLDMFFIVFQFPNHFKDNLKEINLNSSEVC